MSRKRCLNPFGISQGRSNYTIYAVVLREHPSIVKIGRANNWYRRSREYTHWNFAEGDGILDLAVYCITDEYVCLRSLEDACLTAMGRPYRRREWFKASLEQAKLAIEDTLNTAQLSWTDLLNR